MLRIALCLLLPVLLAACSSSVETRTLRFNNGLEQGTGKQFAIVTEAGQANDLEFNHYAELVNRQLQQHGFPQAPSLSAADYRVYFSWNTDSSAQVVNTYPDYGLYGGYGSYGSSIGIGGRFYPYRNRSDSYSVYTHRFELRMEAAHRASNPVVFQGRVITQDGNPNITRLMPCMVAAMFTNFPGPDGVEQTISLPAASCAN